MIVQEIYKEIDRLSSEGHVKVLQGVFDFIDNFSPYCSYYKYIYLYTSLVILKHHLKNKEAISESSFSEKLWIRISDAEQKIQSSRSGMYLNVCFSCSACKSRRKPWPRPLPFNEYKGS